MRNIELRFIRAKMNNRFSAMENGREALANQGRWLGKKGHVSCTAGLQKESRKQAEEGLEK